MRVKNLFMPTLRECPGEAEIVSHQLMLRAAMIRKAAAGVYCHLPLGVLVLQKVENIIRKCMNEAGAQELLMSAIVPAETYQQTGRWEVFGPEMFRLKDRHDRDFCLGPTHEEAFTETVKAGITSYKQLPYTLYQIQTKYRDERRPRFGVMRSREFIMKDAYSFDRNEAGLDASYQKMYHAYKKAFDMMEMDYIVVDADSGAMGGSGSQEFMVKSPVGESVIAFCDSCDFAANDEKAQCVPTVLQQPSQQLPMELVETPNVRTIEDLTQFFDTQAYMLAKTLIYKAGDKFVAAMVRGDREVNETKLSNMLATDIELATAEDVMQLTNAAVGFAGPVGLEIEVYADNEVAAMSGFIIGANKTGYHYKNVELNRDFTPTKIVDLRLIQNDDVCPNCGANISTAQGIEVGHIFKLGTKYSDAMGLTLPDENGQQETLVMGCYGIGVTRCVAAIIEQHSDENGIIWPLSVAPFTVVVVPVNVNDAQQMQLAQSLYQQFMDAGVEVLIDDREERPGVKFKDMDLIGIPMRITVGKKAGDGIVEFKLRKDSKMSEITANEAYQAVMDQLRKG